MKSIAQLPGSSPKEVSPDFPDGAIINETPSQEGTPVVREVYNDVLANIYKILHLVGASPNGIEDNETNGYQIVDALRKLPNLLNDIERQLNFDGGVFSVNLDISNLPTKYFLIAHAAAPYVAGTVYTFKGNTAAPSYSFSSPTGFNTDDEVVIILDQTGVKAYSLGGATASGATFDSIPLPQGIPLAFNSGTKVWYQNAGVLFSDLPEAYDLQSKLRILESDATVLVYEMLAIGNYILVFTFRPGSRVYRFYRFDASNLNAAPTVVNTSGPGLPTGVIAADYQPFIFTDGTTLYITNDSGNSAIDLNIDAYDINLPAATLTGTGGISLNAGYQKTTNSVISGQYLYTFIAGLIKQHNLTNGNYAVGDDLPGNAGVIFAYNGKPYYVSGDIGKKWTFKIYS